MRALITGTSGYLGREISTHLRLKGWDIVQIAGSSEFSNKVKELFSGEQFDLVLHAGFQVDFHAANETSSLNSKNILNTKLLLDTAENFKAKHFLFLGAAGTLGVSLDGGQTFCEDNFAEAKAPFQAWLKTRYLSEKIYCEQLLEKAKIPVTSLLLTTTYGPHMQRQVTASIKRFRCTKLPLLLPPGGTSFLHLEDLLSAIDVVIMKKPLGRYVVSSGNITYLKLVRTVRSRFKPCLVLPRFCFRLFQWLNQLTDSRFPGEVAISSFGFKYYSPGKFMRATGWQASKTLADALNKALRQ
jgi:nucleoside-diphosphate-sugar epimerase